MINLAKLYLTNIGYELYDTGSKVFYATNNITNIYIYIDEFSKDGLPLDTIRDINNSCITRPLFIALYDTDALYVLPFNSINLLDHLDNNNRIKIPKSEFIVIERWYITHNEFSIAVKTAQKYWEDCGYEIQDVRPYDMEIRFLVKNLTTFEVVVYLQADTPFIFPTSLQDNTNLYVMCYFSNTLYGQAVKPLKLKQIGNHLESSIDNFTILYKNR